MIRRMVKNIWHNVTYLVCSAVMVTACAHQQKTAAESLETPAVEEAPVEEDVPVEEEKPEPDIEKIEEAPEEVTSEEPAGPEGEVAKRSADGIDDENALPQPGPAREKFDLAIAEAQENPTQAIEMFLEAAGATTYFYAAYYNAGVAAERAKMDERAEELYMQCLGERPDYGPCLINLVYLYHRQGRPDQSALILQEALEKQGDRAGPHVARATKAFIDKDYEILEKEAKQAIAYDERNIPAMYLMARMFFAQEKFETAKFALQNALVLEPGNALLNLWLGHTFLHFEEFPKALDYYERAAFLRPDLDEAQENYGILLLRTGRVQAAIKHLEMAVKLIPNKGEASLHLANAYRAGKRYEEAEDLYMKALELDEKMVSVHYNLGLLYMDNEIPGMDYLERLQKAQERFDLYAQAQEPTTKYNERLPEFQKTVKKRLRKETKKRERQERRRLIEEQERIEAEEEAARKAAEEAANGDTEAEPGADSEDDSDEESAEEEAEGDIEATDTSDDPSEDQGSGATDISPEASKGELGEASDTDYENEPEDDEISDKEDDEDEDTDAESDDVDDAESDMDEEEEDK